MVADRNTHRTSLEELAVHDNTLISAEEARIRQNAEEERQRRQWEDSQSGNTGNTCTPFTVISVLL